MTTATLGLCSCGCGGKTKIAPRTHTARGWIKGQPQPYLRGHAAWKSRGPRWIEGPVPEHRPDLGPCWIWQRALSRAGYAQSSFVKDGGQRGELVHRALYKKYVGPIPDHLVLDHLCRVPACVRPSHCEPVTDRSNILRGAGTKLTDSDIARVYSMRLNGNTWRVIAEHFGVAAPPMIPRLREFCQRIGVEYPASPNSRARPSPTPVYVKSPASRLIDPHVSHDKPYRPPAE